MPRIDRAMTLKLIDVEFGISAAQDRGERPPNGVRLLSERTDIPRRTLSGIVYRGDQVAEYRIARIARALNVKPAVIIRSDDDDEDEEEKPAPKRETTGPTPRRNGKDDKRGPKRVAA
jgi:hypothetical protein